MPQNLNAKHSFSTRLEPEYAVRSAMLSDNQKCSMS